MILVKIVGGLGNQMFCYAYAKSLQQKGYDVKVDITTYETYKLHGGYQLDKYHTNLEISTKQENNKYYSNSILSKVLRRLGIETSKAIREKSLFFDEKFLKIEDNNYIEGYFQSEKYFKNIRDILIKQFTINQELSNYTKKIEFDIKSSQNSCSIHIRRGDFINNKNLSIHGTCNIEYYKNAIEYLEKKIARVSYFIFSDDIEWCKENLNLSNAVFVCSEEKRIPHEDIYLMSLCNHNIIANSSFSWWGAWLNNNEKKIIIAPKRWFTDDKLEKQSKDIVCEDWIRI
ncbi:alpha-1,2-fucosyltransferase [Arcobacter sp. CECT 8985]|uniref:alpha-1,2-fucosyltransferase n=1 Tax=Arcobacter sp. CECT 8985 TaxID=1935424 RepID=UPI00100B4B10|nr:alpha-1,2-fucosyltransferase [Arcobacter sp. CECT 8985]RXJ84873.1 alpha-1,2-fucosyltransferase [Arcobacter sp. CECT 8985]